MKNIKFFVAALLLVTAGIISFTSNIQKGYADNSNYQGSEFCEVIVLDECCQYVSTIIDCEDWNLLPAIGDCTPASSCESEGGGFGEQSELIYTKYNTICWNSYTETECVDNECNEYEVDYTSYKDKCYSGDELESCSDGECLVIYLDKNCIDYDPC